MRNLLYWLSALVGATALVYLLFPAVDERSLEDAALGDQTRTVIGTLAGNRVHCFTMVDGSECLGPALARGLPRQVLWLGNSQLHAVNQLQEGDKLASVQLAGVLRNADTELLTFSQPNANLQEHLVLFEALSARLQLDVLLLPVVFDDTREAGIRPDVRQSLHAPEVAARLTQSAIGRRILEVLEVGERPEAPATLQDRAEALITAALETAIGWEDLRARARGMVAMTFYRTRNAVFGITPSSIRRKIPATYAANMAALKQILASAVAQDVEVLIYVPPLRSDVPRPYDGEEYAAFKSEVAALARHYGQSFENLEDTVPGPFWGTAASSGLGDALVYDFMHFQGRGHTLLAAALSHILTEPNHDL